jgi:hypothetical protein
VHGFTVNGDAIAMIPEASDEKEEKDARALNISGIARKLS